MSDISGNNLSRWRKTMLNIMQESRSRYHAGVFWKSSAKRMAGLSQEQNESCRRGNIPAALIVSELFSVM